jgi:hypothetical protein
LRWVGSDLCAGSLCGIPLCSVAGARTLQLQPKPIACGRGALGGRRRNHH